MHPKAAIAPGGQSSECDGLGLDCGERKASYQTLMSRRSAYLSIFAARIEPLAYLSAPIFYAPCRSAIESGHPRTLVAEVPEIGHSYHVDNFLVKRS